VNHNTNGVFTVQGFANTSVVCNASEGSVPVGYTSPSGGTCSATIATGTCTIVNNLNSNTFTVDKTYSNGAAGPNLSITLSCTDGTVTNSPQPANHSTNASFTVTGAANAATSNCTASEGTVPSGYTSPTNGQCTATLAVGTCTITNNLKSIEFTVNKDWTPNNPAGEVSVTLSCTNLGPNGAISLPNPKTITGDGSASWTVTGWDGLDPGCTATENPVPNGYISNVSCNVNTDVTSCTITNTLNQGTFRWTRTSWAPTRRWLCRYRFRSPAPAARP
jgi:hypothetical protein